ncbi:hypothetical protein DV515_00019010 [Chloebia gouldiae]|uniref:Uncharacterized protein n=1 Tax=Chloebia gouldiae TaxID=44316 RepID=A0A3L8Q5Z4_CHLGU|nr:hypothetical protein DV515_00019010 [Chloebia gouldiae]
MDIPPWKVEDGPTTDVPVSHAAQNSVAPWKVEDGSTMDVPPWKVEDGPTTDVPVSHAAQVELGGTGRRRQGQRLARARGRAEEEPGEGGGLEGVRGATKGLVEGEGRGLVLVAGEELQQPHILPGRGRQMVAPAVAPGGDGATLRNVRLQVAPCPGGTMPR